MAPRHGAAGAAGGAAMAELEYLSNCQIEKFRKQ
jgi:hypothetical protein